MSEQNQTNQIAVVEKTIADTVLNRVKELETNGRINFPKDYSVANALQSAYLMLQEVKDKDFKPALEVCSKSSIANALFDMVVQGLNPQKKQCYFIVRDGRLTIDRSYFGEQAVAKRVIPGIKEIFANVIYDGDEVVFTQDPVTKRFQLEKHVTKFENRDNPIKGAYCVIIKDEEIYLEVMTWKEIQMSWSKRKNKGQVQDDFPQEMSKRTVIRRGVKNFINASDDSNLDIAESYNRTTTDEYIDTTADPVEKAQIESEKKTASKPIPQTPNAASEKKPEPKEPKETIIDVPQNNGPGF